MNSDKAQGVTVFSSSDYLSMRRRLFVLAIGGALLLGLVVHLATFVLHQTLFAEGVEHTQQQLERSYARDVADSLDQLSARSESMLHNPRVIEAVRRQDRLRLLDEMAWRYERLRIENPYIEVLHFHLPDNTTLLRLHRPEMFGDDLSELRPMIAEANLQREMRRGFEIGKNGISYRVAIPIRDKGEHLGVLEMGIHVRYFTERLGSDFAGEVEAMFLSEEMDTFLSEHGDADLHRIPQHDTMLFRPVSGLMKQAAASMGREYGYHKFDYQGGHYIVHSLFGLENHSGDEVGRLLVVTDVSKSLGRIWTYTLWTSVGWLTLLMLLILGQYVIFLRMQHSIHNLAFYDPLTQLPNRRLLLDRLQSALQRTQRNKSYMALLFIDLDNFKHLNDNHGHHYGDQLLRLVATRLLACVRSSDTVARQGGDEFVIVLDALDGDEQSAGQQARAVAEKILHELNRVYELEDGLTHHSTPSIGVTVCGGNACTVDELLGQADVAMYRAKSAGKNTVRVFQDVKG
jgi:diguanylate cyclase (GGDEF)-like protein